MNKKHRAKNNIYLYGQHASLAALNNNKRIIQRIIVTQSSLKKYQKDYIPAKYNNKIQVLDADKITSLLGENVPHQGIVIEAEPLKNNSLKDFYNTDILLFLDHVTDPHNIGAILRSCAAFGAKAVIMTSNNSPDENGAMAKSASGAVEIVPIVKIANFVNAIMELKEQGFWFIGMDGSAKTYLKDIPKYDKIALIMGSEDKGLRKLTAKKCDLIAKLPIDKQIESLNVSNAAAIALYELGR